MSDDILDSTPDITVETVSGYLNTLRWPSMKSDILYNAQMNKAPQAVIDVLQNLTDDGSYDSLDQLAYSLRQFI